MRGRSDVCSAMMSMPLPQDKLLQEDRQQRVAELHERDGAAACGRPAFSPRPWKGQGRRAECGHGGHLLAVNRGFTQADRTTLSSPVPAPAQKAGRAQVGFTSVVPIRHVGQGCNPESVTCGCDLTSVTQFTECYCGPVVKQWRGESHIAAACKS